MTQTVAEADSKERPAAGLAIDCVIDKNARVLAVRHIQRAPRDHDGRGMTVKGAE